MRIATVQAVRQQYGFCCGYCGTSETDTGATLTVDHYQPRVQGGTDDFANLVYACHACNEHKGDYWNPEGMDRILHPLRDLTETHYAEQEDGTLLAFTPTGQFHINRLQLNRSQLVSRRQQTRERREDREHRFRLFATIERMELVAEQLREAIRELRAGGE
jgi:hypothetical protein